MRVIRRYINPPIELPWRSSRGTLFLSCPFAVVLWTRTRFGPPCCANKSWKLESRERSVNDSYIPIRTARYVALERALWNPSLLAAAGGRLARLSSPSFRFILSLPEPRYSTRLAQDSWGATRPSVSLSSVAAFTYPHVLRIYQSINIDPVHHSPSFATLPTRLLSFASLLAS